MKIYNTFCAYLLCILGFCTGIMGLHRFYLHKYASGTVQFFTLGGFGIWQIIDLFLIPKMVIEANDLMIGIKSINNINQNSQNVIINIVKDELNINNKTTENEV